MALSKKQKSYLLVAILTGGTIIGEGIGLYSLNENVKVLNNKNVELKQDIDSLNKDLKEQNKSLEQKEKDIKTLTTEKDEILNSIEELKKENEDLKQKVEAKVQEQEVSARARVASAEYPTQSTSVGKGKPIQMTLTFYGDTAAENGGYAGKDAQGNKLVAGTVASNVYSFGAQFEFNGQVFTVRDRGGKNFNSYNRLDVFVPRKQGESDSAYAKRIRHYGKRTVTMYKL